MNRSTNLAIRILLYILGVMLVMAAVILLLRGFGWLPKIPEHVLWAMVLFAIGLGILGGLRSEA